jgi:hypothetical protein
MANPEIPPAWTDLIEAITMLAKGWSNEISPFHCEHDTLTVMADPEQFSDVEMAKLKDWGFYPDNDGGFYSFRYGSA